MKKTILSIALAIAALNASAQSSQAENLFEKYSSQDGYTSVNIGKSMFELFAKITSQKESQEFNELSAKLNSLKILSLDSTSNAHRQKDFYQEIISSLPKSDYTDLMTVKEGKGEVRFFIKEKSNVISELILAIGGNKGETTLIALQGDIDLKKLSKLSKSMDIKELKHLENTNRKPN